MHQLQFKALALLFIFLLPHCSQEPPQARKARHRDRAIAFIDAGQYREAIVELKNVVQIDPKDADGHYRLALAYLKEGGLPNLQHAFDELAMTVRFNSTNHDAQLRLGQLHLKANQPEEALEKAHLVLAAAPDNKEGHILLGQSLIGNKKFKQGIAELKHALELDPGNPKIALDLARAYVQLNDFAAAETTLQQTIQQNPTSADLHVFMGDFRIIQNKPDLAEPEFKKALEFDPQNETLIVKLASYYHSRNRLAEAEAIYQQWAQAKPNDEAPLLALGNLYLSLGQQDRALAAYLRAKALNPSSVAVRDIIITYYLDQGKLDDAAQSVKEILDRDSHDVSGLYFKGRLKLAQNQGTEAIALLQKAVTTSPQFPLIHHYLGIAYAGSGDYDRAIASLQEAIKLAPQLSESHGALAKVYLLKGSPDLAVDEGLLAIQHNPRNLDASMTLGESYLRRGDLSKSRQIHEALVKMLPAHPIVHYRLGQIARLEKRDAEAIDHFEQALTTAPAFFEPLDLLADILAAQGKSSQARARITRQLNALGDTPLPHVLLGRLYLLEKDQPNAEASFKKAIQANNAPMIAYTGLAELYVRSGKIEQAMKELETAVAKTPRNPQALMMLGLLLEAQRQPEKARLRYEEALNVNPHFAPAANNLAYYLIENGGSQEQALAYAKTARETLPQEPVIADTLGWVYYRVQSYPQAITLLKEAADKFPEHPEVLYHYGMALAKSGKKAEAKKVLQKSLALNSSYQGAEVAKAMLATL